MRKIKQDDDRCGEEILGCDIIDKQNAVIQNGVQQHRALEHQLEALLLQYQYAMGEQERSQEIAREAIMERHKATHQAHHGEVQPYHRLEQDVVGIRQSEQAASNANMPSGQHQETRWQPPPRRPGARYG